MKANVALTNGTRETALRFFEAMLANDADGVAALLADDIHWQFRGPVEVFPFYGVRDGRQAVVAAIRELSAVFTYRVYAPRRLVVEGDQVAAIVDATAEQCGTGRVVTCQSAQFFTVRDGRLAEFQALFDTFDVVEQVLGRPLPLGEGP